MTYDYPVGQPVYLPNSYGGPVPDIERGHDLTWSTQGAEIGRYASTTPRPREKVRSGVHHQVGCGRHLRGEHADPTAGRLAPAGLPRSGWRWACAASPCSGRPRRVGVAAVAALGDR